jgi:Ca-activated chloride channel family protein
MKLLIPFLTFGSLWLSQPAQSPLPDPLPLKLEVVSPLETDYVTGSVTIEARLVPLAAERQVARMMFYADGTLVCTLTQRPFTCAWNAGATIRARQVRVVAELRDGNRKVHTFWTKGVEQTESSSVSAVQVPTTVTSGNGQFVRGLRPADFTVFEAGVRQKVAGFAAETTDVTLILAVDTSSSMVKSIAAVREQVKEFLAPVPAAWPTTVISFDHSVYTVVRPGTAAADRDRAIDGLKAWGGTALYTAIVEGIRRVSSTIGRKAVVVFTDGDDRDSAIGANELRRTIEQSDAAIYFVAAGDASRPGPTLSLLERLAEISGGRVLIGRNREALREAFEQVREEIRNQYLLTYVPVKLERPGTWRPLSVKVTCEGCRVRARTGYRVDEK